ncbi:OmpH family outer membrane protein [Polaribacter sp. HL-MS24]|uniref:OmpH family outer membrane protein n=1 Tax=Polaribacter sp. HL-MS24 TaxID=3077735 RepID=UPI002934A79A|nr:OmpH family outer membrane protein [Polaribacter sp. HL-MS24]WOC39447.1 OmpH family outer membrane protein [Polaribacter sp. HL-MS24]
MKNLKTLLLIAVFTLGFAGIANAQKIAHVDFERVVANMSETRALFADLDKKAKILKDDIDGMKKKFENKAKKYDAEASTQTEETNQKRKAELQGEYQKLQNVQQMAPAELQQMQSEGLEPINKKAIDAINEVAAAKGILYVFTSNMLIVKKGEDLYEAVKAKLSLLEDPTPRQ